MASIATRCIAANTCAHCGAVCENNMVCHEVWNHDDIDHIATLTAFEMSCRDCDSGWHFGHTLVSASDDALLASGNQIVEHLMKVNGISEREAHTLMDDAFGEWMDGSKHKKWTIEIS